MLYIVAAMFFKMAAEYGRCNSPTNLKKNYVKSLTPETYTLTLESWLQVP